MIRSDQIDGGEYKLDGEHLVDVVDVWERVEVGNSDLVQPTIVTTWTPFAIIFLQHM